MKLYDQLAWVWSVLTPKEAYFEEASVLLQNAEEVLNRPIQSILELGCGAGFLASQFPSSVDVVLLDNAPQMLLESKKNNPGREHVLADMFAYSSKKKYDLILVHDAIMYVPNQQKMLSFLSHIRTMMHQTSVLCLVPDVVRENFYERTLQGGGQDQNRAVHLTEWHWENQNSPAHINVEFSLLVRERGVVQSFHETHTMLVLSSEEWVDLFQQSGFQLNLPVHPWNFGGELFLLSQQLN